MDITTVKRLTLSIAEIPVTLLLDECAPSTQARIAERYADFVVSAPNAPLDIRVREEAGPPYIPLENSDVWQIRTTTRNGRLEFESYFEQGWVERAQGVGEITLREKGDLENFLRVLYAWECLEQNALVLHACGVIRDGQGYVFFGPSGSGKTTAAQLSLQHHVLSDDLVIIKAQGQTVRVFGVPFRGDLPEAPRTNMSAELHGLFTLVKAEEHRIDLLSDIEGVARLAACVPFVMGKADSARRVMEICATINKLVPTHVLHFRRDPNFWRVIDELE